MQVRFARATDHLDEAVRFYRDGLGLDVLGTFVDHDGFDGVMLGCRGERWHIELTHQRGARVGPIDPAADHLMALSFDDEQAWRAAVARMETHGFAAVRAHNPYWDKAGKTFADVDGYRVVLQRGAWVADPSPVSEDARAPPEADAQAPSAPHSAQFLTDARDLYWNDDFLALMSERLALRAGVRRAVDVGSGLGHWTRKVARMLAPGAEIVGVDREARWVASAWRAGDDGDVRISYVQGGADALPFDDASVDLVTCQTLLIHVAEPARVLAEMRRILKPGGVLLCAEPNNMGGSTIVHAPHADQPVDDIVAALRLEVVCARGKQALGLGFNSLGETLVGLLDASSWSDLRVWNADRAYAARAPYPDDARAMLAQERAWHDEGALMWPEDETRRYFAAGGGDLAEFGALWESVRRTQARRFRAVDDGTYAGACGGLLYLVAARRR